MGESSVYSLPPELKGIDPQRIWNSEVTSGYPEMLMLGGIHVCLGSDVKDQEYLAKYLTISEAGNLYSQVRTVAQKLVVAEYGLVNEMFAELLGQKRTFVLEEEKYLVEEAGWQNVRTKKMEIKDITGSSLLGLIWGEARA